MEIRYAGMWKNESGGRVIESPSTTYRVYDFLLFKINVPIVIVRENPVITRAKKIQAIRDSRQAA
jgi:hypothetical protein